MSDYCDSCGAGRSLPGITELLAREHEHVDIQYFTESGTWNRPDRAIRTDYLLIAAGAGGSAPLSDSEPGRDGENGELRAGSFDPATVPEQLQVEIGRGGRGAQYGNFKAGDGADGYALFITHLEPEGER